jgi:phage terminase large subunit
VVEASCGCPQGYREARRSHCAAAALNEAYLARVLREYVKRDEAKQGVIRRIREAATPVQRFFIDHPAKLKAAICSRRAGKSFSAGLMLLERALERPYTKHLYLALTRESAKRILWDDVLKTLNRELKLELKFNETELACRTPNGSVIYLLGADAKSEEQQKLLGQKYRTVVIDEAASYRIDLRKLVYKVLKPATIDEDGSIVLIGTPGDFIGPPGKERHMFYAVTSGAKRCEAATENEENAHFDNWTSFRWTTLDNPHMADKWAAEIADKEARIPHWKETVEFQTEWMGEWATSSEALVYKFDEKRNLVDKVPTDLTRFTIGIDLGFNDATAFHCWGWRPHDNHLYGVRSYKEKGLTLDQVSDLCNTWRKDFPGARMVIDGAARQSVEHLRRVYNQPLFTAAKAGKVDFIRHMNTDLVTERIKIDPVACRDLLLEWTSHIWDDRNVFKRTEKEGSENHLCDSALYSWRDSAHYQAKPMVKRKPSAWSEEAHEEWLEREERKNALQPDNE